MSQRNPQRPKPSREPGTVPRTAARRLDTRGSFCPMPVIETAAAMRAMAPGEILEVVSDDVGVKLDLPAWCRAHRQRLVEIVEEGREIRVFIEKMDGNADPEVNQR